MGNFFEVIVKGFLETTIGCIEQCGLSVKVGPHPGTRLLLKPGNEKRDCFMEGKNTHPHTHTLCSPFLICIQHHLQMPVRRERIMHASF